MPRILGPLWALRLTTAAALLAASASATYIGQLPSRELLFGRADSTCNADGFSECTQSGLPDNFCCETGATCNVLAGNTTVLCCPKGSNCDKISPITCDLGLQDASKNPTAEIKTTALDGFTLASCGNSCCPFGYRCDGGTICVKEANQNEKPTPDKPSSSSTTKAPTHTSSTGKPTTAASTTVAVSGIPTSSSAGESPTPTSTTGAATVDAPSTSSTSHTVTIVAGVIGGIVGIVLIISAVVLIRFRRKQALKKKNAQMQQLHRGSSTSSFGNIISAPVPHSQYPNQRIDFLAKQSQSQSQTAASSPTAVASPPRGGEFGYAYGGDSEFMAPYSPFAGRPGSGMSGPARSYHASAEITGLRSLTHGNGNGNGNVGRQHSPHPHPTHRDYSPGVVPAPLLTITPADRDSRERGRSGSEGESINIFADPMTVGGGGLGAGLGAGLGVGERPDSTATTWSNIQHKASTATRNTNLGTGDAGPSRRQ
ncbi:uncharacterized protein F4822DRAFT_229909 [Hypoxylon trugodes]|uniref:uncharacterized protein n=1 Tax=Hypoxylon trugodes TaxID=326681 RepID=UPI00219EEFBB|nr:uncharacterized protein F4822DRAFT_229909 [Hypoxylon trugodes]KAI1390229.1 hypothetical protein F4822DRAFT_229909 [Hypoxylon trugodes]